MCGLTTFSCFFFTIKKFSENFQLLRNTCSTCKNLRYLKSRSRQVSHYRTLRVGADSCTPLILHHIEIWAITQRLPFFVTRSRTNIKSKSLKHFKNILWIKSTWHVLSVLQLTYMGKSRHLPHRGFLSLIVFKIIICRNHCVM